VRRLLSPPPQLNPVTYNVYRGPGTQSRCFRVIKDLGSFQYYRSIQERQCPFSRHFNDTKITLLWKTHTKCSTKHGKATLFPASFCCDSNAIVLIHTDWAFHSCRHPTLPLVAFLNLLVSSLHFQFLPWSPPLWQVSQCVKSISSLIFNWP